MFTLPNLGRGQWKALLSTLLIAGPFAVQAGGPLAICDSGQPFVWLAGGVAIPFNPDQGNLGPISHDAAVALVGEAFDVWAAVPSATVSFVNAGDLPVDVDITNFADYLFSPAPDGLSAVVFDNTGEIFDLLFGAGSGILGFAGPEWVDPSSCSILEGLCFLNGPAFTDLVSAKDVMVHEFGHYTGLGHSVVNGQIFIGDTSGPSPDNSFGSPGISDVETMYPFYFGPGTGMATLAADDIASLSALYPAPGFAATTATLAGRILAGNGLTPLNGANVIARNLADPFGDAHSAISGDYSFQPGDAFVGSYRFQGLKPGASYALFVDQIMAGGFSTPPIALPGPEEFFNGANESSGENLPDPPTQYTALTVAAGDTASGIDIIFNMPVPGDPLPLGDDGSYQLPLPFPFTICGQTFESVFVNANGSVTFGAPDLSFNPSLSEFLGGPPRIAGLWRDLNPGAGGKVTFQQSAHVFRVVWQEVPEFPAIGSNSFAIVLHKTSNHVDLVYDALTAVDGLVGLSGGRAVTSQFEEATDLSRQGKGRIGLQRSPALFEWFSPSSPNDLAGTEVRLSGTHDFNDRWSEPNNSAARSRTIKLPFDSKDVTRFTELSPAGSDVDFYRFKANAGDIVSAEVLSGNFDSVIGLYDVEKKTATLVALDDDSGSELLSKLAYRVQSTGYYALAVSSFPDFEFTGNGPGSGRYVLDVKRLEPDPSDRIVNGSFEFGLFGWTAFETGVSFIPWTMSGPNDGSGYDMQTTQPQDGSVVLWNGFDGCGPMAFVLFQDVTLPGAASSADLTWMERVQWNFLLGNPTQERTYAVEVRDPATDAVLRVLHNGATGTVGGLGDTGWTSHSASLLEFLGRTVRVVFVQSIPECFTGPGQFEIDSVTLRTQ